MNKRQLLQGTALIVVLGIGFLGGMEYKAYQIRKAVDEAFSGIFGEKEDKDVREERPIVSNDLSKKVSMEITKKAFTERGYQEFNEFTLKLTNNTEKDITGVKGTITFMDLFGDTIDGANLSYDEGIKVGESKLYLAGIDYNQFIDESIELRQIDLENLKYEWEVNTIIYADGTTEEM